MWVALIYALSGEPLYADRYFPTREACMTQAHLLEESRWDFSKIRCVDPKEVFPRDPYDQSLTVYRRYE